MNASKEELWKSREKKTQMDMDILCTSGDLNDIRPKEKEKVVPHYVNKASRVAGAWSTERDQRKEGRKKRVVASRFLVSIKRPRNGFQGSLFSQGWAAAQRRATRCAAGNTNFPYHWKIISVRYVLRITISKAHSGNLFRLVITTGRIVFLKRRHDWTTFYILSRMYDYDSWLAW